MRENIRKWMIGIVAFLLCFSFVVNIHCVLLLIRYREIYQAPPVWASESGQYVNSYFEPIPTDIPAEENVVATEVTQLQSDGITEPADESNLVEEKAGTTVYLTKSGTKFHKDGCSSLSKSKIPISYEDALARGFSPCSRCNP